MAVKFIEVMCNGKELSLFEAERYIDLCLKDRILARHCCVASNMQNNKNYTFQYDIILPGKLTPDELEELKSKYIRAGWTNATSAVVMVDDGYHLLNGISGQKQRNLISLFYQEN